MDYILRAHVYEVISTRAECFDAWNRNWFQWYEIDDFLKNTYEKTMVKHEIKCIIGNNINYWQPSEMRFVRNLNALGVLLAILDNYMPVPI